MFNIISQYQPFMFDNCGSVNIISNQITWRLQRNS